MAYQIFREDCYRKGLAFIRLQKDGVLRFSTEATRNAPFAAGDCVAVGVDKAAGKMIIKKTTASAKGARTVHLDSNQKSIIIGAALVFRHFGIEIEPVRITRFTIGDGSVEFSYLGEKA